MSCVLDIGQPARCDHDHHDDVDHDNDDDVDHDHHD